MKRIREEKQQANQASIDNQSMIEQYNELEFSDQKQRDSPSSGSDKQMELSPDKLKYLGVDKFPWSQKIHQNSETREDYLKKQQSNKMKFTNSQYQNSRQDDGLYSRKKLRQNKQHSFKQHKSFNIDSFLNSQPIAFKHQRRPSQTKIDACRNAHNRNALQQVLQQRSKPNKQMSSYGSRNGYFHKKDMNKIFQQRNNHIKQFIDKNRGSRVEYQQPSSRRNQSMINQSQQSIILITLPQPPQSIYIQQPKKHDNRRHNKAHSLMRHGHHSIQNRQQEQQKSSQLFQVRFQQAKISFLDSFLPESMKIGNNPYNFWKYANSKKNNYLRIV